MAPKRSRSTRDKPSPAGVMLEVKNGKIAEVGKEYHTDDSAASDIDRPSLKAADEDDDEDDGDEDEGEDQDEGEGDDEDDEDEEDGDEDDEDDEDDGGVMLLNNNTTIASTNPPLLPQHLLKPEPKASTDAEPPSRPPVPWSELTPAQKRIQRTLNRRRTQRMLKALQSDAQGTGVLEAGRMAQVKRGIAVRSEQVRSGRVEKNRGKKAVVSVSGREKLLEERKRLIHTANATGTTTRPALEEKRTVSVRKKTTR